MSGFTAAYQNEANGAWLNDLLRGIIDSDGRSEHRSISRIGANTPDLDDQVERPRTASRLSHASAISRRSFSPFSWHSRSSKSKHNRTISEDGLSNTRGDSQQQVREGTPTASLYSSDSKTVVSPSRASHIKTDHQRATFNSPTFPPSVASPSGSARTRPSHDRPRSHNLKAILESTEDLTGADVTSLDESIDDEEPIFKFAPHPAVRPLANREVLGQAAPPSEDDGDHQYPGPLALALIIIGICLSVFVISVDRNIITTVSLLQPNLKHQVSHSC